MDKISRKNTFTLLESIKEKFLKIDELITEKIDNQLHQFNKKMNRLTNRFGIYYLDSVYFNIRKIERELAEILNEETIGSITELSTNKYRTLLDGFSETHKAYILDDILMFEKILSQSPIFLMLKSEVEKKGFTVNVEFIHSSQKPIFKGLYLRFNEKNKITFVCDY